MAGMIVAAVALTVTGMALGIFFTGKILLEKVLYYRELSEKHLNIMEMFKKWLIMLESGGTAADYFHERKFRTVAIYGMGYLGERLLEELRTTDIQIKYIIDKKAGSIFGGVPVRALTDNLEPVDAIIVTPVYYFYSVKRELKKRTDSSIISLEEVLSPQ